MSTPITLPNLGESITEGTVTQWLKREGDTVKVDEPLLEVATDKVDTEIPSPSAGVLTKILVNEDETVEVGAEIALIGAASESESAPAAAPEPTQQEPTQSEPAPAPAAAEAPAPEAPAAAEQQPAAATPPQSREEPSQRQPNQSAAATSATSTPARSAPAVDVGMVSGTSPGTDTGGKPEGTASEGAPEAYVTPLVRKLAAEQGVELDSVTGTGVGGRIRKQDVLAAAQSQAKPRQEAAPPASTASPGAATAPAAPVRPSSAAADTSLRGRTEPMTRLRQTIAEGMVESQQVAAQQTQVIEVDVTRINQLREQTREDFEAREGTRLSYFPFFALATVEALKQHPKLNAVIDGEKKEVTYHSVENLGITVDTDRGLLASVIKDAGDLNLGGLARKIADLAVRTRSGDLSPEELSGGTFTLTNIGRVGALFETPIINQPQVGILSIGDVVRRPVVLEDAHLGEVIAVRSMVHLALSYDQRLVDGDDAARFLSTIRERLEEGTFESEVGLV